MRVYHSLPTSDLNTDNQQRLSAGSLETERSVDHTLSWNIIIWNAATQLSLADAISKQLLPTH